MNDNVDSLQPAQTTNVLYLHVAPTSKRPPAPQQEPPNRRKKPPINEPPLRVPDRSDPEDPAPAGDPPPKRPPSKHGYVRTFRTKMSGTIQAMDQAMDGAVPRAAS
jgi:hypothetical protein